MKILFIYLFTLLFVYPWQQQKQAPQGNLLSKGIYTYTGRFVYGNNQTSNVGSCHAFHAQIFEDKLVITEQQTGTLNDVDIIYLFVGIDSDGNRVYRKDKSDKFLVDSIFDLQRVLSSTTFNGNVTTDTYYEIEKGDHSAEYLEQQKNRLYNDFMFWNY